MMTKTEHNTRNQIKFKEIGKRAELNKCDSCLVSKTL